MLRTHHSLFSIYLVGAALCLVASQLDDPLISKLKWPIALVMVILAMAAVATYASIIADDHVKDLSKRIDRLGIDILERDRKGKDSQAKGSRS